MFLEQYCTIPCQRRVAVSTSTRSVSLRVAIVGAGPAAFYAAERLLKDQRVISRSRCSIGCRRRGGWCGRESRQTTRGTKIGLRVFEGPRREDGFQFHGNVAGRHGHQPRRAARPPPRGDLRLARPADRRLGHPREGPARQRAATEFVAWYNGHPDYARPRVRPSRRRAVIIGNGNVAMDVARMLARSAPDGSPRPISPIRRCERWRQRDPRGRRCSVAAVRCRPPTPRRSSARHSAR